MRKTSRFLESAHVHCWWQNPAVLERFNCAVSLHGHTSHSREYLDFVPRFLGKSPITKKVLAAMEQRHGRRSGGNVPYDCVFWRPPLAPRAAYDLEAGQIRNVLGLRPLVSLTDHDTFEACRDLQAIGVPAPYSVEWTVPFGPTVFHIGVHNLASTQVRGIADEMTRCTAVGKPECVENLLAELDGMSDVLLVLNHPLSCEERVERPVHAAALNEFLQEHGSRMHALELNGLQPASDNAEIIRLAADRGMPVISGGDRHCLEPNANVNLTNAESFAEFVHEVRRERFSTVLFMPQYREPIAARYIEFIWQAVRTYAGLSGRERWIDRVFYETDEQGICSLAELWPSGGPWPVRCFVWAVGLLATPPLRATLRRALATRGEIGA